MSVEPGVSRRALYASLATGAVFAGGLAYTGIVDPHNRASVFPVCPFKLLTGWNCPACGGLRMTNDLLHLDLGAAVVDNVFLLVGVPALLGWVLWRQRTKTPVMTVPAGVVIVVATLMWMVVRNLPGFPLVPSLYSG
jgi:hypothetical protein